MLWNKAQDFRLILASGSPRRRELLGKTGLKFEIFVSDVDENCDEPAQKRVETLARRKAQWVADRVESGIVLASDTLVSLDGKVLGKPEDEKDAFDMLKSLSGREHHVFTGVCVQDAKSKIALSRTEQSRIAFDELTDKQILDYIATGEPMDKAGSYAIQGIAGKFVRLLDGNFDNTVGLPVETTLGLIEELLKLLK